MARLLLALAALVAVVAVSSAEDTSMTERQLMAQLLEKLEKRHEESPQGHTHGPKDTEHHKPMSTKAPMERRWVTRPFPLPERRHEEGSNGHTHDPKDTEDHKQMPTKEPMAIKAPMPTKASKGKEERSEDRLTAVELRELKAVLRALHKRGYAQQNDFKNRREYGEYVARTVKVGSKVTVREEYAQNLPGIKAGFVGTVTEIYMNSEYESVAPQLVVHFDKDTDGESSDPWAFAWSFDIAKV